jgi:hypothetical protein
MKIPPAPQANLPISPFHPLVAKGVHQAILNSKSVKKRIGFDKLLPYVPKTFRFLAKCAINDCPTTYEELSEEINAGLPRNANGAFGSIAVIRGLLQDEPKFKGIVIPDLTSIVKNKGRETSGEGAFSDTPEMLDKPKGDQINELNRRRKEVFDFPLWSEILAYLWIAPLKDLSTPQEKLEEFAAIDGRSTGESPEHEAIKAWICANPNSLVDIKGEMQSPIPEYRFWSLDRLDVNIKTTDEWVGIEIKPTSANADEIRRGLYQVVKYRSLLRAELLAAGLNHSFRCLFVLGGAFPSEHRELAERFGIVPIENVCALMRSS